MQHSRLTWREAEDLIERHRAGRLHPVRPRADRQRRRHPESHRCRRAGHHHPDGRHRRRGPQRGHVCQIADRQPRQSRTPSPGDIAAPAAASSRSSGARPTTNANNNILIMIQIENPAGVGVIDNILDEVDGHRHRHGREQRFRLAGRRPRRRRELQRAREDRPRIRAGARQDPLPALRAGRTAPATGCSRAVAAPPTRATTPPATGSNDVCGTLADARRTSRRLRLLKRSVLPYHSIRRPQPARFTGQPKRPSPCPLVPDRYFVAADVGFASQAKMTRVLLPAPSSIFRPIDAPTLAPDASCCTST